MLAVLPNVKFSKSLSNFFVICSLVLISISNSLFCCLQVSHQFSFLIFPLFSHTRHYSFICTTLFHLCHLVLASISVRYLGFESNFLFYMSYFGHQGQSGNEATRQLSELPLHFGYILSLLAVPKLNLMKHLTMQHLDVFLGIRLFKVSE